MMHRKKAVHTLLSVRQPFFVVIPSDLFYIARIFNCRTTHNNVVVSDSVKVVEV